MGNILEQYRTCIGLFGDDEKCTRSKENGVRYMYGYGCVFLIWNVEQIVEEIDAVHVILFLGRPKSSSYDVVPDVSTMLFR